MDNRQNIVVVGAGIIGCTIAWQLAKRGFKVTVLERGQPGDEATHAAAGMLVPQAEAAHGSSGSLFNLCLASRKIYPDFIAELEDETGIRIGYGQTGSLLVASGFDEANLLNDAMQRQEEKGLLYEELDQAKVHELEPGLSESIQRGVLLPLDHHVDNRTLHKALMAAGGVRGVEFQKGTPVLEFVVECGRVGGVRVPGGVISADIVVNAAGCWAGEIDARFQQEAPIHPVRGQIVQFQSTVAIPRHLVHSKEVYLVPWPDGRVLVGSTMENAGYDKIVTARGIHGLLEGAMGLFPELSLASLQSTWAGLRPASADALPC